LDYAEPNPIKIHDKNNKQPLISGEEKNGIYKKIAYLYCSIPSQ
jgi:hypothetical protein